MTDKKEESIEEFLKDNPWARIVNTLNSRILYWVESKGNWEVIKTDGRGVRFFYTGDNLSDALFWLGGGEV